MAIVQVEMKQTEGHVFYGVFAVVAACTLVYKIIINTKENVSFDQQMERKVSSQDDFRIRQHVLQTDKAHGDQTFSTSKAPAKKLIHAQLINPSIDVDVNRLGRRNDIDFRILVLTYNRPASLKRLLDSLNAVDYMNDKVAAEIWIDMSKSGKINEATYTTATNFNFQKGDKQVINHTRHVGLYGQWMGTWQPSLETQEIVVILEDDLTVSPIFYRYLKMVHKKYDKYKKVNGYALQCSIKLGGEKGKIHAPDENIVFTNSIVGTWGFSPKKINWMNFTSWYRSVYTNNNFKPHVPGGEAPTNWYKSLRKEGRSDTMWEMWHIYFSWINKEVSIYPNLKNCDGLTLNWREIGLHFRVKTKVTDHLLEKWDTRFDHLPDIPIHLDANGHEKPSILDINS